MSAKLKAAAKRAISLLDLTNLDSDCTVEDVENLCARAQTKFGNTAAICIWPQFIAPATKFLKGTDIKIATVVNFPNGSTNTTSVEKETKKAIADAVDEIDLVFPYKAFLAGDLKTAGDQILAIRQLCLSPVKLKVIIETGELGSEEAIRKASLLAIDRGADFIKTSTGKVLENATPASARLMLEAIKQADEPVGFKAAGGLRTTEDAAEYLKIADEIMGADWAKPSTFRFGASSVLANLLATLEGEQQSKQGGY